MSLSRRHVWVLLCVGILVGVAGVPVAAQLTSNQAAIDDGVTFAAPSNGPSITFTGDTSVVAKGNSYLYPNSNTVRLLSPDGNVTFTANGPASGEINKDRITGIQTRVSDLDVSQYALKVDPEGKPAFTVGRQTDQVTVYAGLNASDDDIDFTYLSPDGQAALRVNDVENDTEIVAENSNTGETLDTAYSSGSGSVTFAELNQGSHTVKLESQGDAIVDDGDDDGSDIGGGDDGSGNHYPEISEYRPTGEISDTPDELFVRIEDADFPDGDEVEVNITFDGTEIVTTTIQQNSTISKSISPDAGYTEWTVTAEDTHLLTTRGEFAFRTPAYLRIRNANNFSEAVTDETNVTFYTDDQVYERNTTSGVVPLEGLPTNKAIAAQIDAGANWTTTTVNINNVHQNHTAFLTPLNASDPDQQILAVRFLLEDESGNFDEQDTTLHIRKPINVNGTLQYRDVQSEQFGAGGVNATLVQGTRYRLVLEAPDGYRQDMGQYVATRNETVTLRPGSGTVDLSTHEEGWATGARLDNRTLFASFDDPTNQTDRLKIYIHEKGNKSNQLAANQTYGYLSSSVVQNVDAQYSLTENESKKTWVVHFIFDYDGEEEHVRHEVSNQQVVVPTELDREWRLIGGIGMILLFGGMFSVLNRAVGAVMTSVVGGLLWYTGWLSGATSAAAVVVSLFVAVMYSIYVSREAT